MRQGANTGELELNTILKHTRPGLLAAGGLLATGLLSIVIFFEVAGTPLSARRGLHVGTNECKANHDATFSQRDGESEEETLQRAMRDPEVAVRVACGYVCRLFRLTLGLQRIMGDPIMQSILQQAQGDPAALQDHMKNPAVRANIQKLINAGIIKTRY